MYEALTKRVAQLEEQVKWLLTRQAAADNRQIEPLYSSTEVLDLLRVTKRTMNRYVLRLNCPKRYLRLGTMKRIRVFWESEVMAMLKLHEVPPSQWDNPIRQQTVDEGRLDLRRTA